MFVKNLLKFRKYTGKMSIFTQSFDPITGCIVWEERNPNYDYHQELARSAFADMLHDHERNQKYYQALQIAIDKKHESGQKAHVLDIGTGTGLLSMMAVRCGADSVTACEAFKPMAKCASKIIAYNGFSSDIKLVAKKSTEMIVGPNGDMGHKANILVTEVFDTELIGEGALQTFKHAQDNLLQEDSIVIPSKGTIYGQIVESSLVNNWHRIHQLKDPEDGRVLLSPPNTIGNCAGSLAVHDLQLSQLTKGSFNCLSPRLEIFHFDWTGKKPLIFQEKIEIIFKGLSNGKASGVFIWWDLTMDINEDILLSCAPVWQHPDVINLIENVPFSQAAARIPWRDHWMQSVYYLPNPIEIRKNEEASLIGCHDEYSMWFDLSKNAKIVSPKRPACQCFVHLTYSRTRLGQLNDCKRTEKYLKTLKKYVKPDTTLICFSDGSLLALAATNFGAKETRILEPNDLSRRALETFVQANQMTDRVKIFRSIEDMPKNGENQLIFGEPYFVNSIFPWDNFRFWYLASRFGTKSTVIPCKATIWGVAVEFKDLHKIRAPLGICEGFDLTIFDDLVMASSEISDNPIEVQSLWEYPSKALTAPLKLAQFDFNGTLGECAEQKFRGIVPILSTGFCNGIALWVDWHLDADTIISTGPTKQVIPGQAISWDFNTRQGVYLFRRIEYIRDEMQRLSWSLKYQLKRDKNFLFKFNVE